jgi:hypothetical protein
MIANSAYMLVFRMVHILAGVLWVGSVFLFVIYVQPSAAASGLFLYWHDWHLFDNFGDWIGSRFGVALTVGAISALVAFAIGIFVTRPNVMRMLALGRQVAESSGPPSPEVAAEMGGIQGRLKAFARASLGLLVLSVLAMSTARYL